MHVIRIPTQGMAFSHAFFIKRVYPNDKETVSYNEISLELLC